MVGVDQGRTGDKVGEYLGLGIGEVGHTTVSQYTILRGESIRLINAKKGVNFCFLRTDSQFSRELYWSTEKLRVGPDDERDDVATIDLLKEFAKRRLQLV